MALTCGGWLGLRRSPRSVGTVAVVVFCVVVVVVVVVVVAATVQTAANSVELSNRLWALNFFSRGPYQASLQP